MCEGESLMKPNAEGMNVFLDWADLGHIHSNGGHEHITSSVDKVYKQFKALFSREKT